MAAKVLVIDDNAFFARRLTDALTDNGLQPVWEVDGPSGLAHARRTPPSVIVTDVRMSGLSGIDLVENLRALLPDVPIFLTAGWMSDIESDVFRRQPNLEIVLEPINPAELVQQIRSLVQPEQPTITDEVVEADETELIEGIFREFVGRTEGIRRARATASRLAATTEPVLIFGEPGTGLNFLARLMHGEDGAGRPLIVFDPNALPTSQFESELLGDFRRESVEPDRRSAVTRATSGTLLVRNAELLPMPIQQKLVRHLRERAQLPINGGLRYPFQLILLLDTSSAGPRSLLHDDVLELIDNNSIELPPLRERASDLPLLIAHLLQRYSEQLNLPATSLTAPSLELLENLRWPGNVSELAALLRQSLPLALGRPIGPWLLFEAGRKHLETATPNLLAEKIDGLLARASRGEVSNVRAILEEYLERELYTQVIHRAKGNQRRAANWLGVSRPTMKEKLVKYGLYDGKSRDVIDPAL